MNADWTAEGDQAEFESGTGGFLEEERTASGIHESRIRYNKISGITWR
jgi:hypothetical protein